MTAQTKPLDGAKAKPERKAWKKRTTVDAVLAQIERAKADVTKKEEELNKAKRDFEKLEQVRKLLEKP